MVLILALFVTYIPVRAAEQDDTMIKMQQKDTSQVELKSVCAAASAGTGTLSS